MRLALVAAAVAQATAQCTSWYDTTTHGTAFRNVKTQYGAKGDGVTDDTAALKAALSQGRNPGYTLTDPAVVYFPAGTYIVTDTLPHYFNTYVFGNPLCRPTIKVKDNAPGWGGKYVFDSDDQPDNEHDDNFYHGLANVIIDMGHGNTQGQGIHWAVSQASYLRNITINVNDAATGMFGENGSPTFFADVDIHGGNVGISFGAQQYALRGITVDGSKQKCISLFWDWEITFSDIALSNCPIGIDFQGNAAGSIAILDSSFTNVGTAVVTDFPGTDRGVLFDRIVATNVQTITANLPGNPQGTVNVQSWYQGNAFAQGQPVSAKQGTLTPTRPNVAMPLRQRPFYPNGGDIVNALEAGCKGDGVTDDTAALQAAINAHQIVFIPWGTYLLSQTIQLKSNTVLMGEGFSALLPNPKVPLWQDANNPAALLQTPNDPAGTAQLIDIIFVTTGDVPGCSFIEWRVGPNSGMWDVMWRMYNAGWALIHLSGAGGGYLESMWGWVADHDINGGGQLTVKNPRGMLIESSGPTYLVGTAMEHSFLYQYNFTGASNVTVIMAQTETPYWQIPPSAWGMTVHNSKGISVYGTGFYNWFNGVQNEVFEVVGSTNVNLYAVNTYNCTYILSGDRQIQATTAPDWFCADFICNIPF